MFQFLRLNILISTKENSTITYKRAPISALITNRVRCIEIRVWHPIQYIPSFCSFFVLCYQQICAAFLIVRFLTSRKEITWESYCITERHTSSICLQLPCQANIVGLYYSIGLQLLTSLESCKTWKFLCCSANRLRGLTYPLLTCASLGKSVAMSPK